MTRHGLLWLFAIIVIFLFAPLLINQADYVSCVEKELATAEEWYDGQEVQTILNRTNRLYDVAMVSTGIDPLIRKHFVKPMPSKEVAPGVMLPNAMTPYAEHLMEYWGNFLYNIWMFFFRIAHSWSWVIYLTPFLAAIIFDGVMTRKAKLASFKYTSPTVYNVSWHLIIALAASSMVAFAVVTPLSVFFYPVVITLMGVFVRLVISNIQHSA
ncbi:DUF4400 domain-containing protein [Sulfuricystis multivorans]|uniref:DUF4400 domain-containing protein n=1 Tax=Sulfuricystis multivorans TaxID=2211108 RepID=UPI000F81CBE3|nr:DUF4400 domain-containing protein [Sulfuricystis multivorans]